jgi:hypothetical protein
VKGRHLFVMLLTNSQVCFVKRLMFDEYCVSMLGVLSMLTARLPYLPETCPENVFVNFQLLQGNFLVLGCHKINGDALPVLLLQPCM